MLCWDFIREDQDDAEGDESTEHGSTLCHDTRGNAQSMPERVD